MMASVSSQTADVAERLVRARAERQRRRQPEPGVRLPDLAHQALDLRRDLVGADEDVGVVGHEVADAGQAREDARELVAVEHAVLGEPQRQVAVGPHAAAIDERRLRAVHRLEAERLVLGLDEEHVVAVVLPVAGLLPELLVDQRRGVDLVVAAPVLELAHGVAQRLVEPPALRVPEGGAGAHVVEAEQVEAHARACGGRASSPPRGARGTGRAPPASPRPCRRSAGASAASRRRASTRRRR